MVAFYIIFGLLCFLLGFAIVSWFIVYKEIRNKINNYPDYTEFIEFNDCLMNKNHIQSIRKDRHSITIWFSENDSTTENFNSEEECINRYLYILSCITYYPKS